jgi:hypothetical protein
MLLIDTVLVQSNSLRSSKQDSISNRTEKLKLAPLDGEKKPTPRIPQKNDIEVIVLSSEDENSPPRARRKIDFTSTVSNLYSASIPKNPPIIPAHSIGDQASTTEIISIPAQVPDMKRGNTVATSSASRPSAFAPTLKTTSIKPHTLVTTSSLPTSLSPQTTFNLKPKPSLLEPTVQAATTETNPVLTKKRGRGRPRKDGSDPVPSASSANARNKKSTDTAEALEWARKLNRRSSSGMQMLQQHQSFLQEGGSEYLQTKLQMQSQIQNMESHLYLAEEYESNCDSVSKLKQGKSISTMTGSHSKIAANVVNEENEVKEIFNGMTISACADMDIHHETTTSKTATATTIISSTSYLRSDVTRTYSSASNSTMESPSATASTTKSLLNATNSGAPDSVKHTQCSKSIANKEPQSIKFKEKMVNHLDDDAWDMESEIVRYANIWKTSKNVFPMFSCIPKPNQLDRNT